MVWTRFGLRSQYTIYIDGKKISQTTHRYGNTRHRENMMDLARKAMADAKPSARVCQIVKHFPVQSHKDSVLYTWRRVRGVWRIAPKHEEQAA